MQDGLIANMANVKALVKALLSELAVFSTVYE
jgi:hypothetical protein